MSAYIGCPDRRFIAGQVIGGWALIDQELNTWIEGTSQSAEEMMQRLERKNRGRADDRWCCREPTHEHYSRDNLELRA